MPSFCAVVGCGSRADRDRNSFFRIPAIPRKGNPEYIKLKTERRNRWIMALRRKDLTETKLKYAMICDKHFVTRAPADLKEITHPDWVPSVTMGYENKSETFSKQEKEKPYKRPLVHIIKAVVDNNVESDSPSENTSDLGTDFVLSQNSSKHS